MKILVCAKQVPDMESAFKTNPEGTGYEENGLVFRMKLIPQVKQITGHLLSLLWITLRRNVSQIQLPAVAYQIA